MIDGHRDHRGHRVKITRCTMWQKDYTLKNIQQERINFDNRTQMNADNQDFKYKV